MTDTITEKDIEILRLKIKLLETQLENKDTELSDKDREILRFKEILDMPNPTVTTTASDGRGRGSSGAPAPGQTASREYLETLSPGELLYLAGKHGLDIKKIFPI